MYVLGVKTSYIGIKIRIMLFMLQFMTFGIGLNTAVSSECPTWTQSNKSSSQHECVHGKSVKYAVVHNSTVTTLDACLNFSILLHVVYCMNYHKELNMTLTGNCPYRVHEEMLIVPKVCRKYHRRRRLYRECEENYTIPLYSYNLGCVKHNKHWYNWMKFFAAVFLPLTIFYILVIVCRISATSSTLNGYVIVSQLVAKPASLRYAYSQDLKLEAQYLVI